MTYSGYRTGPGAYGLRGIVKTTLRLLGNYASYQINTLDYYNTLDFLEAEAKSELLNPEFVETEYTETIEFLSGVGEAI